MTDDRDMLKYARNSRRKGHLTSFMSWAKGEPVLVIYPHLNKRARGFAIPRSRIPLYVTETGDPTPTLIAKATEAAKQMGLDTTTMTVNLIVDIVIFNVADLRAMPDSPPKES